jgi:hypothetical protein
LFGFLYTYFFKRVWRIIIVEGLTGMGPLLDLVPLIPRAVPAYIDPGSGSLIIQLVLGGLAGLWVMLKLYGKRLLSKLRKKKDESAA